MKDIVFIDIETEQPISTDSAHKNIYNILDIGCVKNDNSIYHGNSIVEFINFLDDSEFICGHNILNHDLKYLCKVHEAEHIAHFKAIDTLYLSPLLFPKKPYHHLLKDDKLHTNELNNPVNDSKKAKELFFDELNAFNNFPNNIREIFYTLLKELDEFKFFFDYISYRHFKQSLELPLLIKGNFSTLICDNADLKNIIGTSPIELAYSLALIHCSDRDSITPRWVTKNYPKIEQVLYLLRNKPCVPGCSYCNKALNPHYALKKYFGFQKFRTYANEPLQENAVKATIDNKSILAVFPTGGGKSITFQLPALMEGKNVKGLTVVISPLQSLMKDQVDNLEKSGITEAVTINGLLDPIERSKSFERVENGSASLLYISPESLRSKTIEHLLLGRNIIRIVIDEAHCFSSWGQDFRVDYLYIGDFIKSLQKKKNLSETIPVSCFTATAKQKVIEDICDYFNNKLKLDLQLFTSKASRTNLSYKVYNNTGKEEKYIKLRDIIESENCPCIIYVSRTRRAYELAARLLQDGFNAKAFHGKMNIREKSENQDSFISGETQIIVATSAFGMGVDKKDVGKVIHYDISDSLENYVQEAGRAGRDEKISAECFVLFDEEDLNKHFILLNQTKVSVKEIRQIWQAIKELTKLRSKVSSSALEIARKAGWDDSVNEIETRVKTAISTLEESGYIERGQNMPRIYANSIQCKNASEAIFKINNSEKFENDIQKQKAARIIKKLFSTKSSKHSNEEIPEARIDYISDHLAIVKEDVLRIITLLREEGILADKKDLTAFIKQYENNNRSLSILNKYQEAALHLVPYMEEQETTINLKQLTGDLIQKGCRNITPKIIKEIFTFWTIKHWIKNTSNPYSKNHITVLSNLNKNELQEKLIMLHYPAEVIVKYMYWKSTLNDEKTDFLSNEVLVEFSVIELKKIVNEKDDFFKKNVKVENIENTLFYLSRIGAIKIDGGFMVVYNRLTIDRLENNNRAQFKKNDYTKLEQFYQNKIQQIHIVGEYAKKMIENYKIALLFVEDYFHLNYTSFINKYFPGSRSDEIKINITPKKFRQLFASLSPTQLSIIKDRESRYIVVAAGPGSGKTKLLVHKLASLLLIEDVKHEQLLMLTFSRAAATEFKKRLIELVGNAAHYIEIKTFHSYCFDLLGRVGNLEKSDEVLKETVDKILKDEIDLNRITKTVLVIDEAQDMNSDEFELVKTLMKHNRKMRVIAVGDDDQNIFEFRGSSSKYMAKFLTAKNTTKYELTENYRSKKNLVEFTNQFSLFLKNRLKKTAITSIQTSNGRINLFRYKYNRFISPLVDNIISTDLSGSTCVLTNTNEEAQQIYGLLLKHRQQAKLIHSNDTFNLYDLIEIRYFLQLLKEYSYSPIIANDDWNKAKRTLEKTFNNSTILNLCNEIIKNFEDVNPIAKYKSDFESFIRESKLEDFTKNNKDTIFVSTMHKSKGREFDNIFLLLDDFLISSEDKKRQLYVAMTRAKENLTIHSNCNYLDRIKSENISKFYDNQKYSLPEELIFNLTHRDIHLDYFEIVQHRIKTFMSGNFISVNSSGCINKETGEQILKFSKRFKTRINQLQQQHYYPTAAKINYILYWEKTNSEKEIKIILPTIKFKKC